MLSNVPSGNPMYDCWPVGPEEACKISALAGIALALGKFDYFVEAHSASRSERTSSC
jgi:hypothetical protein